MKISYVVLASALAAATMAYGQDYNNRIAVDVTPKAQVEANRENDKREAETRRIAEFRAEQERQRAAQLQRELQRARIEADGAAEAARIDAQGRVDAAKKRKPDVCLLCNVR